MGAELIIAGIGVAVSAASAGYSIYQSKQAAEEAEDIADANAKREKMEAEEMAQRAEKDAAREESLARARAFASGVGGESQEMYLDDLYASNRREIDWIRRSGSSRADLIKKEGRVAGKQHRREAVASGIAGFGKATSAAGDWHSMYKPSKKYKSFDASADAKTHAMG